MWCIYIQWDMYAGEGVEKREASYTVGGNVSWCSHCEKQYGVSLNTKEYRVTYDLGIPLLGISLKKALNRKDVCTSVFIAALYWKQPKCPSTDEWIKKIRLLYPFINGVLQQNNTQS